jgi:hypothetical protein
MSSSILWTIRRAWWLERVARQRPGSQPMLLENGSRWGTAVSGALLGESSLSLLPFGATDGESLDLRSVASASITEDKSERYIVELKPKEAQSLPSAVLVLADDLYLMMMLAASNRASVPCTFEFTPARLKELGATPSIAVA